MKHDNNDKLTGYQIAVSMGDQVVRRSCGGYAPPLSVDKVIARAHDAMDSIRIELEDKTSHQD